MLVHVLIWVLIGQKCETRAIFQSRKKSAQVLGPIKKCLICSNSLSFFIPNGFILSRKKFENMFEAKLKIDYIQKSDERKNILTIYSKKYEKLVKLIPI